MDKTFEYRIYPNAEQRELLQKTFGCCRYVYNKALDRLVELALNFSVKHAGGGNAELIALAAHIFYKDRKVHLTSARNAEGIGRISFRNAEGNVL